jgi:uncharacterized protein YcaQ
VAPAGELRWGWHRHGGIQAALAEMVDAGEVSRVRIQGIGEDWFALSASLESMPRRSRAKRRLHILSPFDSVVMRRHHLARLFGFRCKLECYTPAAKRRWGYFCLPILWGEAFIGRLDAKANRKAGTLIVRKLMCEPGFTDFGGVVAPLAARLRAFAAFNGCERIAVEATEPTKLKTPLRRGLEEAR